MKYIHKENLRRLFGDRAVSAAPLLEDMCEILDERTKGSLSKFISRTTGFYNQAFLITPSCDWLIDLRGVAPKGRSLLSTEMNPDAPATRELWLTMFLSSNEYLGCGLNAILNGRPRDSGSYTVYQHMLSLSVDGQRPREGDPIASYVGMTGRTWQERWNEHLRDAKRGSPYLFHSALREYIHQGGILKHIVVSSGLTFKEAMEIEEATVAEIGLRPLGYNMIPGGFAGLRYLSEQGIRINHRNFEHRDAAIARYLTDNPAIARLWLDPEFAARCMCGWGHRLTVQQIRAARSALKAGATIPAVAELVRARNVAQIMRLASSKTYRRILQ